MPSLAWAVPETPLRVTRGPDEFGPAVSEGFIAWSQASDPASDRTAVFGQVLDGSPIRVHSRGTYGRMGGLDGSRLVFSQYKGIDREGILEGGDLRMFDLATRTKVALPNGINTRQEEFEPSISGDWLLFGRASTGKRLRLKLVLHNLVTGESRVLAQSNSLLGAGQVNGMFAAWYTCGRHPPCDVFRHDIGSGTTVEVPNPRDGLQYQPGVAADGTVYFFRSGFGCGTNVLLQRWAPAGGAETVVDFPDGVDGSSAYVFDRPQGSRHVAYARHKCLKDKDAPAPTDLYQVVE